VVGVTAKTTKTSLELEKRVGRALMFIDIAVAHLKSAAFNSPASVNVEMAMRWLEDARSELQIALDGLAKNIVVYIDKTVALKVARKARVAAEDAAETLVAKCVDDYLQE
jgi:hypothetical protein